MVSGAGLGKINPSTVSSGLTGLHSDANMAEKLLN